MKRAALALAFVWLSACATAPKPSADLLLTGGRVFTGDATTPWVEAIAIRGDQVAAIGTSAELQAFAGPSTRRVDLQGRVVIPGINDAHIHAPWLGEPSKAVSAPKDATKETLLAALRDGVADTPPTTTLTISLPLPLIDAGITRDDLDAISSTIPIRVGVFGGHSAILNTPALRAWNIAEDASDPAGGAYGRQDGRLNGWLYEHAYWNPQSRYAATRSDDEVREALLAFEKDALSYGMTSVQTMATIPASRLEAIMASTPLKLRWRAMDLRLAPYDGRAGTTAVKYILDGTPIERSAAMLSAYADDPTTQGRPNFSQSDVDAMVRDAARGQRQLLVHAVGDRAITMVIDAMERTPADWPKMRVRIEHADMITPDLASRAKRLGVIVVQNPAHFMIPEVVHSRYGARAVQAAKSLLASGNLFAIGSDGPINPYLNLFFAAVHPVNPGEALTVEQTLRAYTAGSAYAEFADDRKGRLTPGMLADLAVLSQDIFTVPPPELPKTTSVMTIVGGKVVWEQ